MNTSNHSKNCVLTPKVKLILEESVANSPARFEEILQGYHYYIENTYARSHYLVIYDFTEFSQESCFWVNSQNPWKYTTEFEVPKYLSFWSYMTREKFRFSYQFSKLEVDSTKTTVQNSSSRIPKSPTVTKSSSMIFKSRDNTIVRPMNIDFDINAAVLDKPHFLMLQNEAQDNFDYCFSRMIADSINILQEYFSPSLLNSFCFKTDHVLKEIFKQNNIPWLT